MNSDTLKVIAVDDEHLALNLLEDFVARAPGLELIGRYQSPVEALAEIRTRQPDLLLLDIQMPGLSGMNLLRSLPRPPVTIFTTAYPDYAVEAYDLDVVDYLLKPFSFERFVRASGKAREQLCPIQSTVASTAPGQSSNETITIKVDGKLLRIPVAEIQYVEGMREYLRLHCDGGRYLTLERFHQLEGRLPAGQFVRIHKSYLAARNRIRALEGNQVEVGGEWLPVSRSKREAVKREVFGSDG
ncbi:LytR/AlgR family response regulator transcription factor [Neolewinella persica]|uniref:LytR/AlgR family response regulator transcription factor n=1 Tax=Neolewinella persica TaxID=70998 RepID=UPI00036DB352|nr:LytTR family DNA-binding domain-containing protein [Neolewinella persica]